MKFNSISRNITLNKKAKSPKTNLKISRNAAPITENTISVSLQFLSKNKLRNFDFFSKSDFRQKAHALDQFLDFIKRLTSKTRLEISSLSKNDDCGFEEIPFAQINCNPDRKTLAKDAKICVFRFGNNGSGGDYRLLGIFDSGFPVLNIIGFDFNYSAYDHE